MVVFQVLVWPGKIYNVYGDVMPVIVLLCSFLFLESNELFLANQNFALVLPFVNRGSTSHDLLIESADPGCRASGHMELDIRDTKLGLSKGTWWIAAQVIAPRTSNVQVILFFRERKTGAIQPTAQFLQSNQKRIEVRNDNTDMPPEYLGPGRRQMELLPADVNPDIKLPEIYIGVASEAE